MRRTFCLLAVLGLVLAASGTGLAQDSGSACPIVITPSEIVVDGENDVSVDITATAVEMSATALESAEIVLADDCLEFITVNSTTFNAESGELTAGVTVDADADNGTCSVSVVPADGSEGCSVSIAIVSTAAAMTADEDDCELVKINPSSARAIPIIPTIRLLKITGASDCTFTRASRADFGTDPISARTLFARGNMLLVLVTTQASAEKAVYDVSVDGIGGVSFEVK